MKKRIKISASELKEGDVVEVGKSRTKRKVIEISHYKSDEGHFIELDGILHHRLNGFYIDKVAITILDKRRNIGQRLEIFTATDDVVVVR